LTAVLKIVDVSGKKSHKCCGNAKPNKAELTAAHCDPPSDVCLLSPIAMSNYHYIPPAQKDMICHLSLSLKTNKIAYHTGISIHTVQRIIGQWQKTGQAFGKPLRTGRPRALTGYHISVRSHSPFLHRHC
jgi:hypothetical protein